MKITDIMAADDIVPFLAAGSKEEVMGELTLKLLQRDGGLDREEILKVLLERERLGSTGIGDGVAIPHAKLRRAEKMMLVFGRSLSGVDFDSLDGAPAHLFFLFVAPENAVAVQLRLLARISRLMKEPWIRKRLLEAADATAIYGILREREGNS